MTKKLVKRCPWCGTDPLYVEYHDHEWGIPVHDDRRLFEHLVLEGAQAGLSWITILRKREGYRKAFAQFDPIKVSKFTTANFNRLMKNPGIIRNRLKIKSAINNAKHFLEVQKEFGSFDKYLWAFVNGKPMINRPKTLKHIPESTKLAETISKDLKRRGFNFVGPIGIYAFLQSVGVVNDHVKDCECG